MNQHTCLLCMGSNYERKSHMANARESLAKHFTNLRFGKEMETEAIGSKFLSPFSNQLAILSTSLSSKEIRTVLKQIEKENGRLPEDKEQGIVKLDIDLLTVDGTILKPDDLKKEFVQKGIQELHYHV